MEKEIHPVNITGAVMESFWCAEQGPGKVKKVLGYLSCLSLLLSETGASVTRQRGSEVM